MKAIERFRTRPTTHMKPVMKQNAASGNVERSGSTSAMRCSLEKRLVGVIQSCELESLLSKGAMTGAGSASFSREAGPAIIIVETEEKGQSARGLLFRGLRRGQDWWRG